MEPLKPRRTKGSGPEAQIEERICGKLRARGWLCISTHGNEFQMGFPDIWAAHIKYGQRWIEVKVKDRYSFTGAQLEVFPAMSSVGVGIWILTSDEDYEINKLFGPPQWYTFLKI
jgi:hypothetical protein